MRVTALAMAIGAVGCDALAGRAVAPSACAEAPLAFTDSTGRTDTLAVWRFCGSMPRRTVRP